MGILSAPIYGDFRDRIMEAYAIIKTGGKQYRVEEGDVLDIELLSEEAGSNVSFDAIAVSDGSALNLGESKVSAEIVDHHRGKKLIAFKKKRRKGYERKVGHRQELTRVKITSLVG